MNIFQTDEIKRNAYDGGDPEYQEDHLGINAEHKHQENERDHKDSQKSPSDSLLIANLKFCRFFIQLRLKLLLPCKHTHHRRQAYPLIWYPVFFTEHQVRLCQFLVKKQI